MYRPYVVDDNNPVLIPNDKVKITLRIMTGFILFKLLFRRVWSTLAFIYVNGINLVKSSRPHERS